MPKLIILEIDGGTWQVADPLIEQNRLPNLARLRKVGAWGILRSIKPMVSPAVWATIFTGKTRDQHGVHAFDAGSEQVRCKRLWDIAHDQGLKCGVCGSLSTWPPYDVGAFMIPDIMARGPQTLPEELTSLQQIILQQLHGTNEADSNLPTYTYPLKLSQAGVKPGTLLAMAREVLVEKLTRRPHLDSYWRRAIILQQIYADAFERLYRTHQPDLATYHYHVVDTLSHKYWHYAFSESPDILTDEVSRYRDVIPSAYEAADRILGQILRLADQDTTVMVLSDHGFQATPEVCSRHIARLARWVKILGIDQSVVPMRLGLQNFLQTNDKELIEQIAQTLASTYIKETNAPALRTVEARSDSLLFVPSLEYGDGMTVVIPGYGEWPFEELFQDTGHATSGIHHLEGILLMTGPQIRPGAQLEGASIIDVTPNALALLNLPIARDMGGRVWKEVFTEETATSTQISYVDTYEQGIAPRVSSEYTEEERQQLYQRLQHLGYL